VTSANSSGLAGHSEGGGINTEKMSSFELWRRGQLGVDVLTFDEVFEQARFIVETQQPVN
jgi:hypothetical protein